MSLCICRYKRLNTIIELTFQQYNMNKWTDTENADNNSKDPES